MSADILQFTSRPLSTDGGKARVLRRRDNFRFRHPGFPVIDPADDLIMDHVDTGMPSDVAYNAPESDPA